MISVRVAGVIRSNAVGDELYRYQADCSGGIISETKYSRRNGAGPQSGFFALGGSRD